MGSDDTMRLLELVKQARRKPRSKKAIKKTFTEAGIITKKGNLRRPYKDIFIPVNQ